MKRRRVILVAKEMGATAVPALRSHGSEFD